MNKAEFILELTGRLPGLPQDEVEEHLGFYSELIDDRMEEGLSEEEAVASVGCVDEIVAAMAADIPVAKIAIERMKKNRRLNVGEIVLLILGSPIWLSLGICALAVVLSVYISLWAVIFSLWATFGSLAACSVGGVLACIILSASGKGASGLAMLAAGLVCAGLAVFMFFGCNAATKGIVLCTKKVAIWIKNSLIGKEKAQ